MTNGLCTGCPLHNELCKKIDKIGDDVVTIKEVQAQRNNLCGVRGEQIMNLKDADRKQDDDSLRQWATLDKLKWYIGIGMGVGIAVQGAIALWGKHVCK